MDCDCCGAALRLLLKVGAGGYCLSVLSVGFLRRYDTFLLGGPRLGISTLEVSSFHPPVSVLFDRKEPKKLASTSSEMLGEVEAVAEGAGRRPCSSSYCCINLLLYGD